VAVDVSGNIYVADTGNHAIRKITMPGRSLTTLAGTLGVPGSADGTGSAARFFNPGGIVVDGSGNAYVADTGNHTIRKITSAGVVTTLAGTAGSPGSADGTGSAARFYIPHDVAVDDSGNVYVADEGNDTIRMITPAGKVTTMAGMAGNPGHANGQGSVARFNQPFGVAVDSSGNIYVADSGNDTIRSITQSMPLFYDYASFIDSSPRIATMTNEEIMSYKVTSGTQLTVVRGVNGTTAQDVPSSGSYLLLCGVAHLTYPWASWSATSAQATEIYAEISSTLQANIHVTNVGDDLDGTTIPMMLGYNLLIMSNFEVPGT
jgi:hypothetical protein